MSSERLSPRKRKTEQDRAREAADVWTVLGLFVRGQGDDVALSWGITLIARMADMNESRALAAVHRLVKWKCLAVCSNELYKLTQDGLECYRGVFSNPIIYDVTDWMREALTGTDRDGKESNIENAVVPTREIRTTTYEEPDPLARYHLAKMVSEELGIDYKEAVEGIERGDFFKCEGVGRAPHMAKQNDRHNLCAACAKRKERQI